jgi:hydroxymethylpyrimidine/phosphomethylpyrimidine kinase
MTQPVACTVAGSDSGGGAGIQADLLSFAACGVHGCSVVVALTAQNTVGVRAMETASLDVIAQQIDAVAEDLEPAAWKTGMLATPDVVAVVAQRFEHHGVSRLVVDPVMVAKSGDRLLSDAAVVALRGALLPLALVVTPNLAETRVLLDMGEEAELDPEEAARRLCDQGPRLAVVKGGHAQGAEVVDVIHDSLTGTTVRLSYPRVPGRSTHGTGCTLSAAIAAFLARDVEPIDAVASARAYLQEALLRAPGLGRGHGPLGHLDPAGAAPVVAAAREAAGR